MSLGAISQISHSSLWSHKGLYATFSHIPQCWQTLVNRLWCGKSVYHQPEHCWFCCGWFHFLSSLMSLPISLLSFPDISLPLGLQFPPKIKKKVFPAQKITKRLQTFGTIFHFHLMCCNLSVWWKTVKDTAASEGCEKHSDEFYFKQLIWSKRQTAL